MEKELNLRPQAVRFGRPLESRYILLFHAHFISKARQKNSHLHLLIPLGDGHLCLLVHLSSSVSQRQNSKPLWKRSDSGEYESECSAPKGMYRIKNPLQRTAKRLSFILHSFANESLFGSVAGTWLFDERRWLDSKDFEDFKTLKSVRKSAFVLACIPSALKFPRRRATTIYNSAFLGCCHAAKTPSSALSRT
jgi:hypothetical protein